MQNIFSRIHCMENSQSFTSVPVWACLVVLVLFSDDTVNVYLVFSAPIKNSDDAVRHLYGDSLRFAPIELRWIGDPFARFNVVHIFSIGRPARYSSSASDSSEWQSAITSPNLRGSSHHPCSMAFWWISFANSVRFIVISSFFQQKRSNPRCRPRIGAVDKIRFSVLPETGIPVNTSILPLFPESVKYVQKFF